MNTKELTDEQIDRIAENCAKSMPDGIRGFCKTWGWRQFARELLDICAGHYRAAPQAVQASEPVAPTEEQQMKRFEVWLRTECFQKPTPEAYELAKCAWLAAAPQPAAAVLSGSDEDTKRLDWLQETRNTPWTSWSERWHPKTDGPFSIEKQRVFEGWLASPSADDPKPTIREAIDAARAGGVWSQP